MALDVEEGILQTEKGILAGHDCGSEGRVGSSLQDRRKSKVDLKEVRVKSNQ